jgi:hypothetical protein
MRLALPSSWPQAGASDDELAELSMESYREITGDTPS